MMDEIFGQSNFQNEIAWYYYNTFEENKNLLKLGAQPYHL